jgi:hypothetical protein
MYVLAERLDAKDIQAGDKFGISWKVGKRRKLRSYHLLRHESHDCDQCCDSYTMLEIGNDTKSQICDNHFRTGTFYLNP